MIFPSCYKYYVRVTSYAPYEMVAIKAIAVIVIVIVSKVTLDPLIHLFFDAVIYKIFYQPLF